MPPYPRIDQSERRASILTAAEELIETEGADGLSARTLARKLGLSPAAIYIYFSDLEEVRLHLEVRLIDALAAHLAGLTLDRDPATALVQLAQSYVDFASSNAQRWRPLMHKSADLEMPDWYTKKLNDLSAPFVVALAQFPDVRERAARRGGIALWAAVHGIAAQAVRDGAGNVASSLMLVDSLVSAYAAGLCARAGDLDPA